MSPTSPFPPPRSIHRSSSRPAGPAAIAMAVACLAALIPAAGTLHGQDDGEPPTAAEASADRPALRGSIVEDRAARKLLDAGDARLEADEPDKALEIWRSVIERFPKSRHRFDAHLRLGTHLLEVDRRFDDARPHFLEASSAENPDDESRAEATLKLAICHHESREHGKAFTILRDLIERFPASPRVNDAYYYLGLGHFKLGHYKRAIEALEKVGTAVAHGDQRLERVETGRRLFLRIDDEDFAILEPGEAVEVVCETSTAGDRETVACRPVGRQVALVLGSIPTALGSAAPGNGILETRGGDTVRVVYRDLHTADPGKPADRIAEVEAVGTGQPRILDGSFREPIEGVVIGKPAHLEIADADRDRSPAADRVDARVEILRRKTDAEVEEEIADLVARGELPAGTTAATARLEDGSGGHQSEEGDPLPVVERFRVVDALDVTFIESPGTTATSNDGGPVHTGRFHASVPVTPSIEPSTGNDLLEGSPGDRLRLVYEDESNLEGRPATRTVEATCIEGDLGDVRAARTRISDRELHLRTRLRTADALTRIGNHYTEFGLADRAEVKYREALAVCREIENEAREVGGSALEETYVQLWRIYFAMEELDSALAMSRRLLDEFPESAFVDEAMLQQAHVARKRGELGRAVNLYTTVLKLRRSPLRGDAQFGIAECCEEMALAASGEEAAALYDRAFTEYRKIYEQFPESGRIGEAVAKMANFYYQKQDYTRAIDVFESVFDEHPDAAFLDVILFNYGRCLYRLDRKAEARRRFDRLIAEYPESPLAAEARQISDALVKAGF